MTEPLPCPFCGGMPIFTERQSDFSGRTLCGIEHDCTVGKISTGYWSRARVMDRWNLRGEPRSHFIPIIYCRPIPEPYYVPPSWL